MLVISETENDDQLLKRLKETLPKDSPEVQWTFLSHVEAALLDWWGKHDVGQSLHDMGEDEETHELGLLWDSLTEAEQIDVMKHLKKHIFTDQYYLTGNHAIIENLELAISAILQQRESSNQEGNKGGIL